MIDDFFETIEEEQYHYKSIAFQELFRVLENNFLNLSELNVIEIASGKGQLTRLLVPLFKNVTAIDPELTIEEDFDNLTKEKVNFNSSNYNCDNCNLLVSCCPCESSDELSKDIIHTSKQYNIPFFIILCNCLHGFRTKEERYIYLKTTAGSNAILYKDNLSIWYLTNLKIN